MGFITSVANHRTIIRVLSLSVLLAAACSVRPYRMKRAERLYRQGQSYLSQGERSKAAEKFEESLALSRMIEYKPGIAHNLNEMAIIHTTQREFEKAREILSESLDIYKELDMAPEVSKTLNNIVVTYAKAGEFEAALTQYKALLAWDRHTGNTLGQAITLNNMGLIYQNHFQDTERAREKYLEALQLFEDLGKEEYITSVRKSLATLE